LRLCSLSDLPPDEAREFELDEARGRDSIFVLRRGDRVHGYWNRCPHRGTPLNWLPDHFLDREGRHIVCATHGALFSVEDGLCLQGPCAGDALRRVRLEVRDGQVFLA